MKKTISLSFLLIFFGILNAQIEVVKMFDKNGSNYSIGFGASLKLSFPVSESAYATVEGNFVYAPIKNTGNSEGIALVPVKLGYRQMLNGTDIGFYIEPQAGYCVYGALTNDVVDEKIHGFDWAIGAGYLFEKRQKLQFDIGLRYETLYFKPGGPASYIALRVSHNFSFGKRESY